MTFTGVSLASHIYYIESRHLSFKGKDVLPVYKYKIAKWCSKDDNDESFSERLKVRSVFRMCI